MLGAMRATQKCLDYLGIEFWLDCGTLLFAIRENRPDPVDTDVSIRLKDKDVFLSGLDIFYANDFRINRIGYHPDFGIHVVSFLHGQINSEKSVDVFIRQEDDKSSFIVSEHNNKVVFARSDKKFFSKLDTFEMDGILWKVPHKPEKYLEAYYGKEWRIPVPDHLWDKLSPPCTEIK
jgi:phosphorylcholine metabolism protein LicD